MGGVMAIGIYRKVRAREGCGERFEALLRSYAAAVVSSEPGCTFLTFLRSPTDSLLFTIHEEYADEYALEQHRNGDLERLWLPVLLRQVTSVTASRFSVADVDELALS
jgi:quinol monooxygenase YgiN